jgi:hypothetical protein
MLQPVVHHVAKACRSSGLVTLRFNFRGVGGSEGDYDGEAEKDDVLAASSYLRDHLPAGTPLVLAGYSYGASMSALAAAEAVSPVAALVLVAFPVVFQELGASLFSGIGRFSGPTLSICGERDDIAPPANVARFLRNAGLDPEEVVIPGCDHLFAGGHRRIEDEVAGFLKRRVLTAPPAERGGARSR